MRTLADIRLPLDGLTVLIGENGAGKSTLVEAFEILRKVSASDAGIVNRINNQHAGLAALLRLNSSDSRRRSGPSARKDVLECEVALSAVFRAPRFAQLHSSRTAV